MEWWMLPLLRDAADETSRCLHFHREFSETIWQYHINHLAGSQFLLQDNHSNYQMQQQQQQQQPWLCASFSTHSEEEKFFS